jgi:hypothetical protein
MFGGGGGGRGLERTLLIFYFITIWKPKVHSLTHTKEKNVKVLRCD